MNLWWWLVACTFAIVSYYMHLNKSPRSFNLGGKTSSHTEVQIMSHLAGSLDWNTYFWALIGSQWCDEVRVTQNPFWERQWQGQVRPLCSVLRVQQLLIWHPEPKGKRHWRYQRHHWVRLWYLNPAARSVLGPHQIGNCFLLMRLQFQLSKSLEVPVTIHRFLFITSL